MRARMVFCVLAGVGAMADPLSAQPRWAVDSVPVLHIAGSGAKGAINFVRAVDGSRLANGTIVIAEAAAGSVRFFDGTGRLTRTVGRRGRGPGEFEAISWLGQCAADSLFVWDWGQARVTVLAATGTVVRQYRVPANANGVPQPVIISCSRQGAFAALSRPVTPRPEQPFGRHQGRLSLIDGRGNTTRTIGDVPSTEWAVDGNGNRGMPRPLGKVTRLALSSDRLYVGRADSALIDVYSLDGRRLRALPLGIPPRRPTQQQYERAVDDMLAFVEDLDMRRSGRRQFLAIPMPAEVPFYSELLVDPDGILWAVLSVPGDPDTRLRAVRSDGAIVADVRIPVGMTVFEIGRDYILGGYEDAAGEPHVSMYRLRRR